ncbi:glycosyltransferase [Candidatus Viridilinea mediisalina]|nr:glycosyltransferase [Candidatus Viridilinea mediisalina]
MSDTNTNELFDAHYYATGCGAIPYARNEAWMALFNTVATGIVTKIAPTSVLDAGCAIGLLVEQLRGRGVDAEGVDISTYAISQVHEQVRPFVRVGSVAEPFARHYDLIVCIEVLEHMPRAEAERAVANFCAHSADILFSSSPDDYQETTHFNVNPPEYWAEIFAQHGFFRDVDFDASFITPWAVRFRRRSEPCARIVRDYERSLKERLKEARDLRTLNNEQRTHIRELEQQCAYVERQLSRHERDVDDAAHIDELERQHAQLLEQLRGKDDDVADLQHRVLQLEHAFAIAQQQRDLLRRATQFDRQVDAPLSGRLHDSYAYTHHLEAELARRDQHITWLEGVIRSFEQGRVMTFMRRLLRRGPILPPVTPPPPPEEQPLLDQDPAARYARWIAAHEPAAATLQTQRSMIQQFPLRPLLTLLTPVYNPPVAALEALVASIQAQTYEHWEWCVADASTDPTITQLLHRYATADRRIKLRTLSHNAGISANSNAALEQATGEFVLLLDHDDTLAPESLFQVVQTINAHPAADVIYYDEDKLSEDGALRHSPWFKPARCSPDLMLSTNYLMHATFRRTLVDRVGGFVQQAEGAQDWDLALRCLEQTQAIYHIPRILYHWRQVPGSAARDANAKPWALAGQEYALRSHLQRLGVADATLQRRSPSDLRIVWPTYGRLVSIIIPNRDQPALLRACISSILHHTSYPAYEIIIIDNASTDPRTLAYYAELQAHEHIRIVAFQESFNWSRANNLGAAHAHGDLLLFLNNDTEVRDSTWLEELVGWAERPEVGLVGCRLVRPNGTTQHAGMSLGLAGHASSLFDGAVTPLYGPFGSSEWYRNLLALTGACMLTRREVFTAVGGFDQRYRVGYSDITFSLAVHDQGLRVVYTPHTTLLHHEGASRGLQVPAVDVLRATFELLPRIATGDPYYSPNLSPIECLPAVAEPQGETWPIRMAQIMANFNLIYQPTPEHMQMFAQRLANLPPRRPQMPDALPRLLLCSHELSLSGGPLILVELARFLVAQGYMVTIVAAKSGALEPLVAASGSRLLIVPDLYNNALSAALVMRDYDLVLCNTIFAFRAIHAAHMLGLPCLWWIHEAQVGRTLVEQEVSVAAALNLANDLIFPTATTAALYADCLQRPLPAPLPNGVSLPKLERTMLDSPTQRLTIVVPATIEPRKGQDCFVAALQNLPAPLRHTFDLYFIGVPLDHTFYLALRRDLAGWDNVYFTGLLSRDETLNYLAHADIFVLPSRDEVLPLTLLEAMAYAKAILVTDVGGITEAVRHGQEALVVPSEDPVALAAELELLLRQPALRMRLGSAARLRYEQCFTFEQFAAAMQERIKLLSSHEV